MHIMSIGKNIERMLEGLLRSGSVAKVPLKAVVYARHGREFMGCKSPMCESCRCRKTLTQTLADGKGVSVRKGLKAERSARLAEGKSDPLGSVQPRVQNYEPTNRNSI